ncbi:MAG TPA: zinc-dependent metalloprotease, partial [Oscillatoriaceae cyanobacterium M33_DOE_052]|nr:zinc-dependent metalloprotease [Oscillatoriaceae cyanobacterium M33_DOE_052]
GHLPPLPTPPPLPPLPHLPPPPHLPIPPLSRSVNVHLEAAIQPAMGALAASLLHNLLPNSEEMEEYVHQALRFIVAHEVGHVLGLRHNFHGSTMLSLQELHNQEITQKVGLTASVMDYLPANLAPPGVKQGDYFSGVVGPYDKWAIEYGYKPLNAVTPEGEKPALAEIAQASSAPELAYAPDEDSFDFLNPWVNVFDLSSDILGYSQAQMENAREMWQRLDRRYPLAGESYEEVRSKFNMVLSHYIRQVMNTTMYVAGQSFSRNYASETNSRLPFEAISGVQQRQALALLQEYVFEKDAFQFSPELLNKLAPERWYHWGASPQLVPLDYPIGDQILWLQRTVLRSLLSPLRLTRLRDAQLKANSSDVLTLAELFDSLQKGIWTEVIGNVGDLVEISSIRRELQREYFNLLQGLVLRKLSAPEDARSLAWYNLRQLDEAITKTLKDRRRHLDVTTLAHLEQTHAEIGTINN